MNAYERRQAERGREAGARRQAESQEREYNTARIADKYESLHLDFYGTTDRLKYINGWYVDERGHRWRKFDIITRVQELLRKIDMRDNVAQIDHPEYLEN